MKNEDEEEGSIRHTSDFPICATGQLVVPLWRQGALEKTWPRFEREDHEFGFGHIDSELSLRYPNKWGA